MDGSLSVAYKAEGFTGAVMVIGNLAYGQDPEGNERDGEARAAVLGRDGRVVLGVDARARSAIGAQHGTPASREPKLDVLVGPLAMLRLGSLVFLAEAGSSMLEMPQASARLGLVAFAGLASAF